jgi:hypothetical protein
MKDIDTCCPAQKSSFSKGTMKMTVFVYLCEAYAASQDLAHIGNSVNLWHQSPLFVPLVAGWPPTLTVSTCTAGNHNKVLDNMPMSTSATPKNT